MLIQLWDASGLAKRYAPEVGSDIVDALWETTIAHAKVTNVVTYAEVYSLLLRKFNRGAIDQTAFDGAKSLLRAEIINDPQVVLLSIEDAAFYQGIALMNKHNVNSTDAALLVLYLAYAHSDIASKNKFLLIAADERLVRAAQAEGLMSINPEQITVSDVAALLTTA